MKHTDGQRKHTGGAVNGVDRRQVRLEPACWNRVKAAFAAMIDMTPAERARYLDEHCADDSRVRDEIDTLLAAHDGSGCFLERDAADLGSLPVDSLAANGPGVTDRVLGPYELVGTIGEGGFGTVYEARQTEPIERTVALKVLKLGMDTRAVIARFETERRALALMNHPGIARVFDAGATSDGRPYFAMERVDGVSITAYCNEHDLSIRERVELFLAVCRAVEHAHQKGVIHRDIKPGNVMVAMQDGRPVPKVIDFGIAKAAATDDLRATAALPLTGARQLLGTIDYMSPEQTRCDGVDIDTRSDIYSLGVVLYELLVGRTPHAGDGRSGQPYDTLLQTIRETGVPRPSACADLPVRRELVGDLDWILLKALEKDRDRRYDAVSAFVADLERFLNDEPVLAGPPSTSYRMRKFVRRHRAYVAAGAFAAAALIIGLTTAIVGFVEADRERDNAVVMTAIAQDETEKARRAEEAVRAERDEAQVQRQRAEEMQRRAQAEALRAEEMRDRAERERQRAVAAQLQANLERERAEAAMQRAAEAEQRALAEASKAESVSSFLGKMLTDIDPSRNETEGDISVREVLDNAAGRLETAGLDERPRVGAAVHLNLGRSYVGLGELVRAEQHFVRVIDLLEGSGDEAPEEEIEARLHLARLYLSLGRLEEARALGEYVHGAATELYGTEHPFTVDATGLLGRLYQQTGDNELAVAIQAASAPSADDPAVRSTSSSKAELLEHKGDHAGAEVVLRDAVEQSLCQWAERQAQVRDAHVGLGFFLARQGRFSEAEKVLLQAVDHGTLNRELASRLASFYDVWGRPAAAETWRKRGEEVVESVGVTGTGRGKGDR